MAATKDDVTAGGIVAKGAKHFCRQYVNASHYNWERSSTLNLVVGPLLSVTDVDNTK
jgi:hypothetical protein